MMERKQKLTMTMMASRLRRSLLALTAVGVMTVLPGVAPLAAANGASLTPAAVTPMSMTVCTARMPDWFISCTCGAGKQVVIKHELTYAQGRLLYWGITFSHMNAYRLSSSPYGENPHVYSGPGTYWVYTGQNGPVYARSARNTAGGGTAGTITLYCQAAMKSAPEGEGRPDPVLATAGGRPAVKSRRDLGHHP